MTGNSLIALPARNSGEGSLTWARPLIWVMSISLAIRRKLFSEGLYFIIEVGAIERERNFEHRIKPLTDYSRSISKFTTIRPTQRAVEFTIDPGTNANGVSLYCISRIFLIVISDRVKSERRGKHDVEENRHQAIVNAIIVFIKTNCYVPYPTQ